MISCQDLLNLEIFKNIKLLAGENGLYKTITWPYICQSIDFYKWINGGELLFLTGMGMDLDHNKLVNLIYKCREKSISGLVILTNSEFIKDIPPHIINLCDEIDLPLFKMPWNLKIIDVSKSISNYIMEENFKSNTERELLKELIFTKDLNMDKIHQLIRSYNIKSSNIYFSCVFKSTHMNLANNDYLISNIKNKIELSCNTLMLDVLNNEIILIVGVNSENLYSEIKFNLKHIHEKFNKDNNLFLIFGDRYKNLLSIKDSYNDAIKAYELYKYNSWNDNCIDYSILGFYKILFEVNSINKLRDYSEEILKPLIDISDSSNLNLLETLKCYLTNDCNLLKSADELFIHRNTLIYRLNKIKEVLKNNLENARFKNELLNALMIRDYLNYVDCKNNKLKYI